MASYANITLGMNPLTLRLAREYSAQKGTTVNALVREFLENLTKKKDSEWDNLEAKLGQYSIDMSGFKFSRKEMYDEIEREHEVIRRRNRLS